MGHGRLSPAGCSLQPSRKRDGLQAVPCSPPADIGSVRIISAMTRSDCSGSTPPGRRAEPSQVARQRRSRLAGSPLSQSAHPAHEWSFEAMLSTCSTHERIRIGSRARSNRVPNDRCAERAAFQLPPPDEGFAAGGRSGREFGHPPPSSRFQLTIRRRSRDAPIPGRPGRSAGRSHACPREGCSRMSRRRWRASSTTIDSGRHSWPASTARSAGRRSRSRPTMSETPCPFEIDEPGVRTGTAW